MRRGVFALAVVLLALAAAPSASAHAILQESSPANDEVVRVSPPAVTLKFNEAVETAFGSIRVYNCGGERVDSGKVSRPDQESVSVLVGNRLPRGSYTVTWRVISADSHPVAGAFVFHVGKASRGGECKQVFGKGTPRNVEALFKFVRALDFALVMLVLGGAVALAAVLASAAAALRSRLYRILGGLALGLIVAGILCIVLQGAVAGGFGLTDAFRWSTVDSVLQTNFGKAFLFQLAFAGGAAVLALVASRVNEVGWVVLIPAVCLLPTLSAAGHARTSGAVAFVNDVIHLTAGSVWVGGLAFTLLALMLAGEDRWPLASRAVPRFSILAVGSVVVLIAAGTVRGYQEVRAWHGLWDTTYGQLLLVKIALVLPLLALGAYNNRFAVPRLKKQIASLAERRRFLRAAGVELAIMATVLGVTAVLVTEPPAKASVKPPKYISSNAPIGNLEVNYLFEPAKTGSNVIHLYFFTPQGIPAGVANAKMSATLPSAGIGPLRIPLQRIVPSHYTTSNGVFPQAGDWQVRIEIRQGQFKASEQTVTVPIREG